MPIIKYDGKYFKVVNINGEQGIHCKGCYFEDKPGCINVRNTPTPYNCKADEIIKQLSAKERFFLFLKQEQVFWRWWYGVIKGQNNGHHIKKLNEPSDYILNSFIWKDVSEVSWGYIENKWRDILNNEGYLNG